MPEDFIRRISEDILTIFCHLIKISKFVQKLKIQTKTKRSTVDLKNISNEDLSKTSIRFELNIFQRSSKDFRKKLIGDVLKKINVDL